MNRKLGSLVAALLVAVTLSTVSGAHAQDADADDIGAYTCRSLLLASGDEREGTILVLHAYLLGEAKQTRYDPEALGAATDLLLDACTEKPDALALDTLRKVKQ